MQLQQEFLSDPKEFPAKEKGHKLLWSPCALDACGTGGSLDFLNGKAMSFY